jgi:hypothetical protein
VWSIWWNESWQGKQKHPEKTCPVPLYNVEWYGDINDELPRIGTKDTVGVMLVLPHNFPGGTAGSHKKKSDSCVPPEIRTDHLPKLILESCRYSNLCGSVVG